MIGSSVVKIALEKNYKILCIIRKDSKKTDNMPRSNKIKIVYADLTDYSNLNISENYDLFFHLAWDKTSVNSRDNIDSQLANIKYTLDAVRLAKNCGCKKFIGAGSQAEYGICNEPLKSNTPANPESAYGIAKYTAGKLSHLLCNQLNIGFNWARILSVYGPSDGKNTLIMYTINELLSGNSPELTKCEQIWDYLYCDDAAEALIAIGEKGINGKIYPLGSGNNDILSNYIEKIQNIVSPNSILQFGKKDYFPHQPMYLAANITELTNDTGWRPKISFENGVKKIFSHLNH